MDSSKLTLEFVLFAFAVFLSIKYRKVKINQYLLWTVTIGTLITNIALFYLNIDFLTVTYYSKASQFYKYFLINLEITKWTVLSYTITRFNLSIEDRVHSNIGFAIDGGNFNILKIFSIGLIAAIIAAMSVYFIMFSYYWTGIINVNPTKIMQPIVESMRQFAFFGGIRNLFGEEIIARLGVQTLILYYLGDRKFHVSIAIILSSFFFFLWHDGIGNLNPANFIASLIFGIVYSKYKYEAAAISHCLADWIIYFVVPLAFPMLLSLK